MFVNKGAIDWSNINIFLNFELYFFHVSFSEYNDFYFNQVEITKCKQLYSVYSKFKSECFKNFL